MKWQFVDGLYFVTLSGLVSWKFRNLTEAINWAFTTKLAQSAANGMENNHV